VSVLSISPLRDRSCIRILTGDFLLNPVKAFYPLRDISPQARIFRKWAGNSCLGRALLATLDLATLNVVENGEATHTSAVIKVTESNNRENLRNV
jgi:hypothetical protein